MQAHAPVHAGARRPLQLLLVAAGIWACGAAAQDLPVSSEIGVAADAAVAPAAAPAEVEVAASAATGALPSAATAAVLPDLDPDAYFKGQTGGTFGKNITTQVLPKNRRVAVAGFRVVFITHNTAKAQVRASYLPGRDSSGAKARMDVSLAGVDPATLQAITDHAYAAFLEQLRASGREVVGLDEMQGFISQLEATPVPYTKDTGMQTGVAYSPTGIPLWWTQWDAGWTDKSPFKQNNQRRLGELSQSTNAITIAPLIVVDFAQMSSSGNRSGLLARDAEVGATLGMSITAFSTSMLRAEETRSGMVSKGDEAGVALLQPFGSELAFATMAEAQKSDNKSTKRLFDALGGAMGLANGGGAASSKSDNTAQTDNAAYAAAAQDVLGRATGTFARLFQKYPAS